MSDRDATVDYFSNWRAIRELTDLSVFATTGYGGRLEVGLRPALLVINSTYRFVGIRGASLATSMETCPLSCGPAAWSAVSVIRQLIDRFRSLGLPVIYSAAPLEKTRALSGMWVRKSATSLEELPRGKAAIAGAPFSVLSGGVACLLATLLVVVRFTALRGFRAPVETQSRRPSISSAS